MTVSDRDNNHLVYDQLTYTAFPSPTQPAPGRLSQKIQGSLFKVLINGDLAQISPKAQARIQNLQGHYHDSLRHQTDQPDHLAKASFLEWLEARYDFKGRKALQKLGILKEPVPVQVYIPSPVSEVLRSGNLDCNREHELNIMSCF